MSAEEGSARQRFTLAHKIGHWVCQCLGKEAAPIQCRSADVTLTPTVRALERETNVFAAAFLMHEGEALGAWPEFADIAAYAARLDVTAIAMQWRLYGFGLVEERPS